MSKDKTTKKDSTTRVNTSRWPGVNNDLVILSHPVAIKENSFKPSKRKDKKQN